VKRIFAPLTLVLVMAPLAVLSSLPFAAAAAVAAPASAGEWLDASAPIDPRTAPVYPGNAPIKLDFMLHYDKGDKLALSSYSLGAHTGTHVDAPLHFIKGAQTVDQVPIERFVGPARVIDCSPDALVIDAAELNKHEWHGAKRILFRTRNSRNGWMTDPKFHEDFTYVAPDAAQLLADAGVELVGIDYLSIEKYASPDFKTHRVLLGKGIPVVEGLWLTNIQAGDYDLIVLPLRIAGHEAAPARAVLRRR
jgi:arylformamidase